MQLLEINDKNIDILIDKFNMTTDKEGFLIDKSTKERKKCKYTNNEIKKKKLGGILPGSTTIIEDSDFAYSAYVLDLISNKKENG